MYNFILGIDLIYSAKAKDSGSENGDGPAYDSEQGFFDAPTSKMQNIVN